MYGVFQELIKPAPLWLRGKIEDISEALMRVKRSCREVALEKKSRASEDCLHYPWEEFSLEKEGPVQIKRIIFIKNQVWKIILSGKGKETNTGFADIKPETEVQFHNLVTA